MSFRDIADEENGQPAVVALCGPLWPVARTMSTLYYHEIMALAMVLEV
jgi:hypothetical protein